MSAWDPGEQRPTAEAARQRSLEMWQRIRHGQLMPLVEAIEKGMKSKSPEITRLWAIRELLYEQLKKHGPNKVPFAFWERARKAVASVPSPKTQPRGWW